MRPAYRARQFLYALRPGEGADRVEEASAHLSDPQLLLFRSLPPADQAHGLRVLRTLQAEGRADSDLMAAALLHDVGKARFPLRPWARGLAVLVKRLAPRLADRWGKGEPTSWQRPFVVAAQHPKWGAELVAEVGGSERLVRLIRHHQDGRPGPDPGGFERALKRLQLADDQN